MDTRISVCASTVRQIICEFISEAQLDIKLRGIGTDGASSMIGCNGVVARLKETALSAIGVQCNSLCEEIQYSMSV